MCHLESHLHSRCGCVHHGTIVSYCEKFHLKPDGRLKCQGTVVNQRNFYGGRPLCENCYLEKSTAVYKYFDQKEEELAREMRLGLRSGTAAKVLMQYHRDEREKCIRRLEHN